jgi:hypothetical protein
MAVAVNMVFTSIHAHYSQARNNTFRREGSHLPAEAGMAGDADGLGRGCLDLGDDGQRAGAAEGMQDRGRGGYRRRTPRRSGRRRCPWTRIRARRHGRNMDWCAGMAVTRTERGRSEVGEEREGGGGAGDKRAKEEGVIPATGDDGRLVLR